MRQLLTVLSQVLRKSVVVLVLMSAISLSGLCLLNAQPSYAATQTAVSPQSEKQIEKREQAYEAAIETANNPEGLEKEYEKNLADYKEDHPENPIAGAVEGAKDFIEKATNQK
jgi:hypothetical protein